MLTLSSSTSFGAAWVKQELRTSPNDSSCSVRCTNTNLACLNVACSSLDSHHTQKQHDASCSKVHFSRVSHHLSRSLNEKSTAKTLLHRFHVNASSDEDFRSSRNIAISLFRRYRNVIDRGAGETLKEFINAGVNAYALGCTDEGLRKELIELKESGLEIEGQQTYGGSTRVKFKVLSEEVHECIFWLSIIFITILCTPQPTVIRWSSTPPVSTETLVKWKGFCALIANAYYMRGMAWLPVKTLQLEQTAVMGSAEEPSVVASRMRLVFSTLEVVSPQWPRV